METKLPKRVRVARGRYWYVDHVGEEFEVSGISDSYMGGPSYVVVGPPEFRGFGIGIYDCTPIYEEEEAKEEKPAQESPFEKQVGGNHYKGLAIQPAHFIHANGIGFLAGNVIKYVTRYKEKNGRQDLEKAKHYIEMLIDEEYPDHPPTP